MLGLCTATLFARFLQEIVTQQKMRSNINDYIMHAEIASITNAKFQSNFIRIF